jgi:6-phosphogluconolactonase
MFDSGGSKTNTERPRVIIVEPGADFAELAARIIAEEIKIAIAARGVCSLMLSGGTTPRPVYAALVAYGPEGEVDWWNVRFYYADERCVPPDHPDSNYRMTMETLLDPLHVSPAHIERMQAEEPDLAGAAERYGLALPERIDVLLLGIGEDCHTASLFPGSPALDERSRKVVAVEGPKPPPCRLTITPPVIANARTIIIMASGTGKAAAVARALEDPYDPHSIPAQLALRGTWVLDREAASRLRPTPRG